MRYKSGKSTLFISCVLAAFISLMFLYPSPVSGAAVQGFSCSGGTLAEDSGTVCVEPSASAGSFCADTPFDTEGFSAVLEIELFEGTFAAGFFLTSEGGVSGDSGVYVRLTCTGEGEFSAVLMVSAEQDEAASGKSSVSFVAPDGIVRLTAMHHLSTYVIGVNGTFFSDFTLLYSDITRLFPENEGYFAVQWKGRTVSANFSLLELNGALPVGGASQLPLPEPAHAVYMMIARLPSPLALSDYRAVFAARKAYAALPHGEQITVLNEGDLTVAEHALRTLLSTNAATFIAAEIAALPEVGAVTEADAENVLAVYELYAFAGLDVWNIEKLFALSEALQIELPVDVPEPSEPGEPAEPEPPVPSAEVVYVSELIAALPTVKSGREAYLVEIARTAYDNLTDEERAQVIGYDKLCRAETALANLTTSKKTGQEKALAVLGIAVAVIAVIVPFNIFSKKRRKSIVL